MSPVLHAQAPAVTLLGSFPEDIDLFVEEEPEVVALMAALDQFEL